MTAAPREPNQAPQASMTALPSAAVEGGLPPWYTNKYLAMSILQKRESVPTDTATADYSQASPLTYDAAHI